MGAKLMAETLAAARAKETADLEAIRRKEAELKAAAAAEVREAARHAAAVTIQKAARGRLARKDIGRVRAKHEAAVKAARERDAHARDVQVLLDAQAAELAAVKLQSVLRGHHARKSYARRREAQDVEAEERDRARQALVRDLAASKIQALFRGRKGRARFARLKADGQARRVKDAAARAADAAAGAAARAAEATAAAAAAAGGAADTWDRYWDEGNQAYYYFNARTQEARWTKPGEDDGYGTTGNITDYDAEAGGAAAAAAAGGGGGGAGSGRCIECEARVATRTCDQCGDDFCDDCYASTHAKGKKATHTYHAAASAALTVAAPYCVECEAAQASRTCDQCGDNYCDSCFASTHAKGKKATHTWKPVAGRAAPMCVECETKPAARECVQCADKYCEACYEASHRKGKKAEHSWLPVGTDGSAAIVPAATEWIQYFDAQYQRYYYFNSETQEAVWDYPPHA